MRPISAVEMLDAWDRASALGPARRALELLRAASPEEPPEALAALSIGTRDARLLTLREWFFGPRIEGQIRCRQCSENIEASFPIAHIRTRAQEPASGFEMTAGGTPIRFRLPDSTDLDWLERRQDELRSDPERARHLLLERCILAGPRELSERAESELVARMGELDPQAETRLAIECPACHHRGNVLFDVGGFLWQEIHAWARRMLREVHALASAYGWSEREIVSMSAARRAAYLEMVGS
ncbi:MAG: phage baseplate protein [Bryobacteraceae bacterium]|jgi:hypothetical protein